MAIFCFRDGGVWGPVRILVIEMSVQASTGELPSSRNLVSDALSENAALRTEMVLLTDL
jgi:hypothetical protein